MADVLDTVLRGTARPDLEGIAALLPQTRMWVRKDRFTQRYVLVREDEEYPGTSDDGFEVVTMATGSKAALEMAAAVPGLLKYIQELEKELEAARASLDNAVQIERGMAAIEAFSQRVRGA